MGIFDKFRKDEVKKKEDSKNYEPATQNIPKAKTVFLLPLNYDSSRVDERYLNDVYENEVIKKGKIINAHSPFGYLFQVFRINHDDISGICTDKTEFVILLNEDASSDELVDEINGHLTNELEKIIGFIEPQEEYKENSDESISLKSAEAYTRDVGMGIARIDPDSMNRINVSDGNVIEIKGKRRTVAKCLPLYPSDEGKEIIRIDGLIRNNSGLGLEGPTAVRKLQSFAAENIVVIPLQKIPPIDNEYFADALEAIPVVRGDFVMVPYFGGRLTFVVSKIIPDVDAVLITKNTIFQIEEKDLEQYTNLQAWREALQSCNNILYYDKKNVEALIEKGKVYSAFDKNKESMELVVQALEIDPNHEDAKRFKKDLEDKGKSKNS